jgi:hypothetical protein
MYSYLLQDWVTIRGDTTIGVLGQGENDWLDLDGFQEIVAWLDVKEVSFGVGAPTMYYQTSPSKDAIFFVNMGSVALGGPGLTITPMLKETAAVPLARWLRWQIQVASNTSWDITFRIWCAANVTGTRRPAT